METSTMMKILEESRRHTRELLDRKGGWPVITKPIKNSKKQKTENSSENNAEPLSVESESLTKTKKRRKLVVPEGTTVQFSDSQIEVKGPLGALYLTTSHYKSMFNIDAPNTLSNTYHSLLQNAIKGVSYGYVIKLKVRGTGYKVIKCVKDLLSIRLGHSHLSKIKIPNNISVTFNRLQQILCTSTSKEKLAEFAARIKRLRARTAFRPKGIFEVSEPLPNKAPGKAGRKG